MFENVLASVRIGAAEVDTRLERDRLRPGDPFAAEVVVTGGEVDQDIEGLELRLTVRLAESDERKERVIDRWEVAEPFTIGAGEERVIPVEGRIHPETPVTEVDAPHQRTEVWIDTGLSIDRAVDASDRDGLRVEPTPEMAATLSAVERCGLALSTVHVDDGTVTVDGRDADLTYCDQEFTFLPTGIDDPGFATLQLHFVRRADHTDVLLEFEDDRGEEWFRALAVDHGDADPDAIAARVREYLPRATG